jgi:hypothetical protein
MGSLQVREYASLMYAVDEGFRSHTVAVDCKDHELVSAEARNDIGFAEDFSQDIGSFDQGGITFHVAELVVDSFHIVEVCVDEKQLPPCPAGELELLLTHSHKTSPVEEPGKLVSKGECAELFFSFFAVGNLGLE